jgi:hypothetical protein
MRFHRIDLGDEIIYTRFPDLRQQSRFTLISWADVVINKKTNEIVKCRWPLETIFEDFLQIMSYEHRMNKITSEQSK